MTAHGQRIQGPTSRRARVLAGAALAVALGSGGCARDAAPARQSGPASASNAPAVTLWQPARISSPLFESHAAFDPWNGDLYLVRSSPEFQGWRILVSRCGADGTRSEPAPPVFAGSGVEADPFFTDDGRGLYYISTRSRGSAVSEHLDIWRVDRDRNGVWAAPVRLPEPVNSDGAEWFPRPSRDGWLYFGSSRPGGLGKNDIWRARADEAGQWTVENLGPAINTAGQEYEPLPSPDGTRLIIMGQGGLFESRRTLDGWSPRVKLPPEVNQNGSEIGALFSPTGRSLLFSRDTRAPLSGEFFVWQPEGPEPWPPPCPDPRG
jgi:WD40-like Beta Propeller Repeat